MDIIYATQKSKKNGLQTTNWINVIV